MNPRKQFWFFLLAFVLLAGLLAGCNGKNNKESGGKTHTKIARGEIKAVNRDKRKIILKLASAAKTESTTEQTGSTTQQGGGTTSFHVAQNAKITVLGKEAQLTDLKAGQQAEIQYSVQKGGANKAVNVNVTGQPSVAKKVTGEIKKVNLDTKKIWVRPSSEQDKIISFKILPGATIMVNSQNAELADLKAGQQAQIQYFIKEGINRARSVKVSGTAAVSGPTPG
jgi:Cu/Ag efflux protein CusF